MLSINDDVPALSCCRGLAHRQLRAGGIRQRPNRASRREVHHRASTFARTCRGQAHRRRVMFKAALRFIGNRRCRRIGLEALNPVAWIDYPRMSESIEQKKEKNLFEIRVTENHTGGALFWN